MFSQKKAFLIFSQKKAFLIFPEIEPSTFQLKLKEIKENLPQENLFCSKKQKPRKNFLYFLKKSFL